METPTQKPSLVSRIQSHRLTTTFVLLGTLSIGIVAGSVLTRGVSGKEQTVDSSDARPLTVPDPVMLSNGFSKIAKAVGPAVVNIKTEELAKPVSPGKKGKRGLQRGPLAVPPGGDGGDDSPQNPNDMQDFFNHFFGGQGGQGGEDGGDGADGGSRRAWVPVSLWIRAGTSSRTTTSWTRPTKFMSTSRPILTVALVTMVVRRS